jgi:hypothetical protein
MRYRCVIAVVALAFATTGMASGAFAQDRVACDLFIKNTDGSWVAQSNADIPGLGRKLTIRQGSVLKPGATILSVDIAALLDEQCPSVLPAAPAAAPQPDLQQRYADPNGNIDIQTLTCGQLVSTYQEDAEFVLLWSSGWYNGLARKSAVNVPRVKESIRSIIAYCQVNKDKRLTQAIDAAAKNERR